MTSKKWTPVNILLGILGMVFFLSLSVTITLNARFLYYGELAGLSEENGLSEEEIRANYDALIDYNSMFSNEELRFPTLPMSEHGKIHFAEVKRIFVALEYACIFSGILFLAGSVFQLRKRRNCGFLFTTWIIGTAVPAVVGLLAALNWDWFFVAFHHVMFRNDYWLFDPATDPIIDLLPDSYFFLCLAVIVVLMVVLTQGCGLLYQYYKRRRP